MKELAVKLMMMRRMTKTRRRVRRLEVRVDDAWSYRRAGGIERRHDSETKSGPVIGSSSKAGKCGERVRKPGGRSCVLSKSARQIASLSATPVEKKEEENT